MCGALRLNTLPPVLAHHACYDESSVYEHGVAKVETSSCTVCLHEVDEAHLEGTLESSKLPAWRGGDKMEGGRL